MTSHASLLKVLVGALAFMCWMAQAQQTAIWGANAGWVAISEKADLNVGLYDQTSFSRSTVTA